MLELGQGAHKGEMLGQGSSPALSVLQELPGCRGDVLTQSKPGFGIRFTWAVVSYSPQAQCEAVAAEFPL